MDQGLSGSGPIGPGAADLAPTAGRVPRGAVARTTLYGPP